MKIGILTYHRAINYGAVFQAYGLMTYLKELGHDAQVIDYWPQHHIDAYKLFNHDAFVKRSLAGKLKYLLEFTIRYSRQKRRDKGCVNFMYENFNISKQPKYLKGEDIKEEYDLVLYGSDQIWWKSPLIKENSGFDTVYFGKFPINALKKVSYAASMGVINVNEDDREILKTLLSNFDDISVRETNLLKLVQECGFNSELTLDPVFLLKKEQWEKLIPRSFKRKDKYILFYHHTPSKDAKQLVEHLSKEMGCKIVEVNSKVLPYALGTKYKNACSPGEFLGLFRDAEFVVSTSFHGTVFSVLMNKQFYALGMGKNAERSKTLLKVLGINDRYIEQGELLRYKNDEINYSELDGKLSQLVSNSKKFIENYLN